MRSGRVAKVPPLSPLLSKDVELWDIKQDINIGNLIVCVNSVTVPCLIHYDSLLQMEQILLQNAAEIYCKMRQVFFYKMGQFHYKTRQLLQIATILSQNGTFVTKCDSHYKVRQYT